MLKNIFKNQNTIENVIYQFYNFHCLDYIFEFQDWLYLVQDWDLLEKPYYPYFFTPIIPTFSLPFPNFYPYFSPTFLLLGFWKPVTDFFQFS